MKKFLPVVIFFAIGCSTIFSGSSQTIPVITKPKGADVRVYSSENKLLYKCVTPCRVTMKKKDIIGGRITISKEGFQKADITLGKAVDGCFYGNVCIGIIPGIIDIVSGTWRRTRVMGIYLKMKKAKYLNVRNQSDDEHFELISYYNGKNYTVVISKKKL